MNKLALLSLLLCGFAAAALADRDQQIPVRHVFASSRTAEQIQSLADSGFRMHDIEVVATAPYRFAGSFVKNEGAYAKSWWWTADQTEAGLKSFYEVRGARLIDLEISIVNGQRRYAATMVANTGDDSKEWWWRDGLTQAEIAPFAASRQARIVDIEAYRIAGAMRYAVILIANTGSDQRDWGFFTNASQADLVALSAGNRRTVDVERVGTSSFAGIWEQQGDVLTWRRLGQTWDQLRHDAKQFGARVADIERYTADGQARFDYVLINNSNALETRLGQFMRTRTNGKVGFYLRQIGGPVHAALMEDENFYPASTIKVLQHAHLSHRVGINGLDPDQLMVPHYTDHTSDVHPNDGTTIAFFRTATATARRMMFNSDNQATNALQDLAGGGNGVVGRSFMENFKVAVLGLGDELRLHHKFSSGGPSNDPANKATAASMASIYATALHTMALGANGQVFFRDNMLGTATGGSVSTKLRSIVVEEAAALGLTIAEREAFWSQTQTLWKAGNWGTSYVSCAGWFRIPVRSGDGRVGSRSYVACAFVDNTSYNLIGNFNADAYTELIRDEVRKALASW